MTFHDRLGTSAMQSARQHSRSLTAMILRHPVPCPDEIRRVIVRLLCLGLCLLCDLRNWRRVVLELPAAGCERWCGWGLRFPKQTFATVSSHACPELVWARYWWSEMKQRGQLFAFAVRTNGWTRTLLAWWRSIISSLRCQYAFHLRQTHGAVLCFVELSIRACLVSVLSLSWQLVHFHQENGGEQAWRVLVPHSGKFSMRSSLTILECLTFPDPSLPLHIL
jgi:hypothetical protein